MMTRNVDPDMALARSVYANAAKRAKGSDDPQAIAELAEAYGEFAKARHAAKLRRLRAEYAKALADGIS